jgi:hypothetical protein
LALLSHGEIAVSYSQTAEPRKNDLVEEVQGTFSSEEALQIAVDRLTKAGFDRARLVVPSAEPFAPATNDASVTPNVSETDNPKPEDDGRQLRTLHSSMAATTAALAGAAAVVATGGAAVAAVAAAAGAGALAGGGMFVANNASDAVRTEAHEQAASRGQLRLIVAVTDESEKNMADGTMRAAGATDVLVRQRPQAAISGQAPVI